MRTIKRTSVDLNTNKRERLKAIAIAYSKEKQHWLNFFQKKGNVGYIKQPRKVRDRYVASKYKSPYGLQARMWKLALEDASNTMDKYWQSVFADIKRNIYQNDNFSDLQRHFAFWLLKTSNGLDIILNNKNSEFKDLTKTEIKIVIKYLQKQINKKKKSKPKIKLCRSFGLDANCYNSFTHNGKQYINIMTMAKGKRLAIPLLGDTVITGNIQIIINNNIAMVHYSANLKVDHKIAKGQDTDNVIGVDFGYSEVITDNYGEHYGRDFGSKLTDISDKNKSKMQKRHKLHAIQKKLCGSTEVKALKKARNILKFNLGKVKQINQANKDKTRLTCIINKSYNKLLAKKPSIIVSEDLSNNFTYKNTKNWNRRLSVWVRGKLEDRLEFKALAKGFSHKQVNPAYSSQLCQNCGYVDRKNRSGDKFKCQYCRHVSHADWIAALNHRNRYFDQEITRYMPYCEVKQILLRRFHRRLETHNGALLAAGL